MLRDEFSELRVQFETLLAETPSRRIHLLESLSQSKPALAEELRRMLAAHDCTTGLIDHPAADLVAGARIVPGIQLGAYRLE